MISRIVLLNTIFLVITSASIFKTKPKNFAGLVGEDVYLRCNLNESDKTDMQWLYNGILIRDGTHKLPIWDEKFDNFVSDTIRYRSKRIFDITIVEVSFGQDGTYTCKAGNESASANVTVFAVPSEPILTSNLTNFVKNVRDGMSLNCSTSGGYPLPQYTWTRNDEAIIPSIKYIISPTEPPAVYAGLSSSKLDARLNRHDDGAVFQCSVSYGYNRSAPKTVEQTVEVLYSPTFVVLPFPLAVMEGEPWKFTCWVDGNPPVTVIHWSKDGIAYARANGTTKMGIYILERNVSVKSDTGLYTCWGRNSVKSGNTENIELDILYAPVVTLPREITVNEDETLTIPCTYDSHPVAESILWSKDTQVIHRTANLSFDSIQRTQAGTYSCHVTNIMTPSKGNATIGEGTGAIDIRVIPRSTTTKNTTTPTTTNSTTSETPALRDLTTLADIRLQNPVAGRAVLIMGAVIGGLLLIITAGVGLIVYYVVTLAVAGRAVLIMGAVIGGLLLIITAGVGLIVYYRKKAVRVRRPRKSQNYENISAILSQSSRIPSRPFLSFISNRSIGGRSKSAHSAAAAAGNVSSGTDHSTHKVSFPNEDFSRGATSSDEKSQGHGSFRDRKKGNIDGATLHGIMKATTSSVHHDIPKASVDTKRHHDIPKTSVDTKGHTDIPKSSVDTKGHHDIPKNPADTKCDADAKTGDEPKYHEYVYIIEDTQAPSSVAVEQPEVRRRSSRKLPKNPMYNQEYYSGSGSPRKSFRRSAKKEAVGSTYVQENTGTVTGSNTPTSTPSRRRSLSRRHERKRSRRKENT